jgi:MATE family multidrug resistance protein
MPHPIREEFRQLMRLAIPLAAAQAGTQLMSAVDAAVVGRLGATELGAVGLGNAIFFTISIIGTGIVMGIDPLASQAFGAGDEHRARRYLWQGVWLSIGISAILSVVMALAPLLLRRMQIDRRIVNEATTYLLLRILSLLPSLLFIVVRSYLQAKGVVRPMVVAMILGNVVNFGCDLLFVFGGHSLSDSFGPLRHVPAMGVGGAALATGIGSVVQLLVIAASAREPGRIDRSPHRADIRRAFDVGLPAGLQWGAEAGIFLVVGMIAATFGARQLAAHQIALTLVAVTFTVAVGIGAAGSVRVGRAIGAGDAAGTRRAGLVAFLGAIGFMSCTAIIFLAIPGYLARLLTDQKDVIAAAIPLLAVAGIFQLSDGTQAVGSGILRGTGDTRFPFFANVVGHWVVGLPVAILLGFKLGEGVAGLWWGLCAGLTAVALLLFIRFERKSARLIEPLVRIG